MKRDSINSIWSALRNATTGKTDTESILGNHKCLHPDLSGGCPYIGSIPVGVGFLNPLGEETSPLRSKLSAGVVKKFSPTFTQNRKFTIQCLCGFSSLNKQKQCPITCKREKETFRYTRATGVNDAANCVSINTAKGLSVLLSYTRRRHFLNMSLLRRTNGTHKDFSCCRQEVRCRKH